MKNEADETFRFLDNSEQKHQHQDNIPIARAKSSKLIVWLSIIFICVLFFFILLSLTKWFRTPKHHLPVLSKEDPFIFIHIGKTGGSTVHDELKIHGFRYEELHINAARKGIRFYNNETK